MSILKYSIVTLNKLIQLSQISQAIRDLKINQSAITSLKFQRNLRLAEINNNRKANLSKTYNKKHYLFKNLKAKHNSTTK